jgi:hypothetical protein
VVCGWVLVNGVENIVRFEADINRAMSEVYIIFTSRIVLDPNLSPVVSRMPGFPLGTVGLQRRAADC